MRFKLITATRRMVRCLAPGPDHSFLSKDPARDRICPRCRKYFDSLRSESVYSVAVDRGQR